MLNMADLLVTILSPNMIDLCYSALHRVILIPLIPESITIKYPHRLREITENSSGQISNGFGSCSTEQATSISMGYHPPPDRSNTMLNEMGSSGFTYSNYSIDNSSQNNVGGPTRLHAPKNVRLGRRVSDGGPYVASYKLFIEKRTPQLSEIRSSTNIDRTDSSMASSSNSVRVLLQERKAIGGQPYSNKEWLHFKNQVRFL